MGSGDDGWVWPRAWRKRRRQKVGSVRLDGGSGDALRGEEGGEAVGRRCDAVVVVGGRVGSLGAGRWCVQASLSPVAASARLDGRGVVGFACVPVDEAGFLADEVDWEERPLRGAVVSWPWYGCHDVLVGGVPVVPTVSSWSRDQVYLPR